MTRHAGIYAVLFTLTLALLVGAAIRYGVGQPPSDWAALLRLDDCQLPCWVGIEPGVTTLEQAQAQLRLAFGDTSAYVLEDFGSWQFAVNDLRSHYRIGITLEAGNDPSSERQTIPPTVQQIILWADVAPMQRVSLRDLYGSLNTPEDVQLTWIGSAPYLMILYRQDRVGLATTALGCYSISPAQKIYQIIISARPLGDYFGWVSPPASWLGFRRCHDLRLAFTS